MAVVKSGVETIVRHSRVLIAVYNILIVCAGILALLSLMVAIGYAADNRLWSQKFMSVGSWIAGGLALGLMSAQLYTMARALSRSFVAIGNDGVRLRLPRSDGSLWTPGAERNFKWDEIRDISYEGNLRKRECKFHAGHYIYTLTANNCPSPKTVARLLAEKKGVILK